MTLAATTLPAAAAAQGRVVMPAGTVILVHTTTALESASARVGDTFETTVVDNFGVDGYTVIPSGSRIRGRVTLAQPATRQQSGVIQVTFDRMVLANGGTVSISGALTSTDSAERRQIKENPNARVALVGARGGIGATIAGAAPGGSNNLLSALGSLLSEGRDVSVPAGTPLAVEIERAVSLRGGRRLADDDVSAIYTATDRVRAAQRALSQQNYYRGASDGRLDDATRRALFQFQADHNLSATGNLDGRTLAALGVKADGAINGRAPTITEAATLHRNARTFASRLRADLGVAENGRVSTSRSYSPADLELWFAVSALDDNSALYEQVVRRNGSGDATVLSGQALAGAMSRVDAAMQNVRVSSIVSSSWAELRRDITAVSGGM
ncbi:MAG: peptidoglycan-binding domain-containing protein [bacterium]